jgi:hypothetical protein
MRSQGAGLSRVVAVIQGICGRCSTSELELLPENEIKIGDCITNK